jgi:tRNA1(Val) A37 N6-methylase TrmN6
LIRGNKGGSEELRFLPELVVYDEDGKFSKEICDIYSEVKMDVFNSEEIL